MKRIYSKGPPAVMRHRGMISVPVDIQPEPAPPGMETATDPVTPTDPEENTSQAPQAYSCHRIQIPDTGQDLTSPDTVLAMRRQAEHQAVNQTYAESLAAGCPVESLGFRVDCKPENCSDFAQSLSIWSMAYADKPNAQVTVRDYDNVNHDITYAEFQVLCQELGAHVMRLRQEKWAAVDALANLEA